ncbi:hypothetical protein C2M07_08555 [Serratia marcescens]|nr:hypothetical protein C2M07_08555 [Serratia marcescens]PNU49730.1 hypothetical protein C2M03_07230 [Serratia marcescens]
MPMPRIQRVLAYLCLFLALFIAFARSVQIKPKMQAFGDLRVVVDDVHNSAAIAKTESAMLDRMTA